MSIAPHQQLLRTDRAHIDAVWRGFLQQTEPAGDELRALRALTLHMLEAHAPATFVRLGMASVLDDAVAQLAKIPVQLPPTLAPAAAQARVDAAYVRQQRGQGRSGLDPDELEDLLWRLVEERHVLHAWVLGELAAAMSMDRRVLIEERWYQGVSRRHDLYWCTHRLLLASRYLRLPLRPEDWQTELTELVSAAPWIQTNTEPDLAAEVLFCLQCVEAPPPAGYHYLLDWLLSLQTPHGGIRGALDAPHTTAAALLALAGDFERCRHASPNHQPWTPCQSFGPPAGTSPSQTMLVTVLITAPATY